MKSHTARARVTAGTMTAAEAVEMLLVTSNRPKHIGELQLCPECMEPYEVSLDKLNTCSDKCQDQRNAAIFELDGGRTIHRIEELSPERVKSLLEVSGIYLDNDVGEVLLS